MKQKSQMTANILTFEQQVISSYLAVFGTKTLGGDSPLVLAPAKGLGGPLATYSPRHDQL